MNKPKPRVGDLVVYRDPNFSFGDLKGAVGIVQSTNPDYDDCIVKWMYQIGTYGKSCTTSNPPYSRIDVIQDEELQALIVLSMLGD